LTSQVIDPERWALYGHTIFARDLFCVNCRCVYYNFAHADGTAACLLQQHMLVPRSWADEKTRPR
jgi:hypothetical protein